MRFIIVGTRYTTSTECSSIAASVASASKRGSTTRCAPASSATHDQTTGPLWYSGPGISRHPSGSTPRVGRASGSIGRRVAGDDQLRPAGRAAGRRRLPRRRGDVGQRRVVDRRVRHVAGRQAGCDRAAARARRRPPPSSRPARRWPAARRRAAGTRRAAGSPRASMPRPPSRTSRSSSAARSSPCRRARRRAPAGRAPAGWPPPSNPARVIESSPQVISTRSGSAAARSVNRRAYETISAMGAGP